MDLRGSYGTKDMETSSLMSFGSSGSSSRAGIDVSARSMPKPGGLAGPRFRSFFPVRGLRGGRGATQRDNKVALKSIFRRASSAPQAHRQEGSSPLSGDSFSSESLSSSTLSSSPGSKSRSGSSRLWNRVEFGSNSTKLSIKSALVELIDTDDETTKSGRSSRRECHSVISVKRCVRMTIAVAAAASLAVLIYQSTRTALASFNVGDLLENSGSASVAPAGGGGLLKTLLGGRDPQSRFRRLPQDDILADLEDGLTDLDAQGTLASDGTPAPLPQDPSQQGDAFYYEDAALQETAREAKVPLVPSLETNGKSALIPAPKHKYELKSSVKKSDSKITLKERNRREHLERWKDRD